MRLRKSPMAAALAALLSQTAMAAPVAPVQGGPSAFVMCDGYPNDASAAGTVARLIAITALVGLFLPPPESADTSKRLKGRDGVDTCKKLIDDRGNNLRPGRRSELAFAQSIHQIEAKNYDAAIADARAIAKNQPDFSAQPAIKLSFGLAALETEVMALLASGKPKEAHDRALDLANAAPYDYINLQRASRYLRLTGVYGPREMAFFDAMSKLNPVSIRDRADLKLINGDIKGAAADLTKWAEFTSQFTNERPQYALALAALGQALIGDLTLSKKLGQKARVINNQQIEEDDGSGTTTINLTKGTLEFLDIVDLMNMGKAGEARKKLGTLKEWNAIHIGTFTEIIRRARIGAPAEDLIGPLAKTPAELLKDELAARLKHILPGDGVVKDAYSALRPEIAPKEFDNLGPNVWTVPSARYIGPAGTPDTRPRYITVQRDGGGTASGYAVLLHAALTARAEGKRYFMVLPGQTYLHSSLVRIANAGDPGLDVALSFEAEKVIADLGPLFPKIAVKTKR